MGTTGRTVPGRIAAASLAAFLLTLGGSAALADCVAGLSYCAVNCDQRTKPEQPDRPQCAQGCIAAYQRCERIDLLQSNTGPGVNQVKPPALAQ